MNVNLGSPTIRTYKADSILYFEKEKAEDVFVLQKGRVVLTYTSIEGKSEIKEDVKIGEFFGVKSALGKYPREETAQVVGTATILCFKLHDFESFVSGKTHLILKMMKVFSSQLRNIHGKVRERLGQHSEARSPAFELMNVAEVFYKHEDYDYAVYTFQKYIEHYPTGKYAGRAAELLKLAKRKSPYPSHMQELTYIPEASSNSNSNTIKEETLLDYHKKAKEFEKNNKIDEAIALFKLATSFKTFQNQQEIDASEDSYLCIGYHYHKSKRYEFTKNIMTNYLKQFPKGSRIKEAVYLLGEVEEHFGEYSKAMIFYQKVAMLPPNDSFTEQANLKISQLKGVVS